MSSPRWLIQEELEDTSPTETLRYENDIGESWSSFNIFFPKITRLLEDSLGGNCKTTIVATISPAQESFRESVRRVGGCRSTVS